MMLCINAIFHVGLQKKLQELGKVWKELTDLHNFFCTATVDQIIGWMLAMNIGPAPTVPSPVSILTSTKGEVRVLLWHQQHYPTTCIADWRCSEGHTQVPHAPGVHHQMGDSPCRYAQGLQSDWKSVKYLETYEQRCVRTFFKLYWHFDIHSITTLIVYIEYWASFNNYDIDSFTVLIMYFELLLTPLIYIAFDTCS